MTRLKRHLPGVRFRLVDGTSPRFRGKGGAIQRGTWPYIEVIFAEHCMSELWVDIEALALSGLAQGMAVTRTPNGLTHELDVLMVVPGATGRVDPALLQMGGEAKRPPFSKALLKELLGVRAETGICVPISMNNIFAWWAAHHGIPTMTSSGIVVFCAHQSVLDYTEPSNFWGIEMAHHPA